MAANQLIDTLTAHISYYNLSSPSTSQSVSTNPNPRNSILKWFSSLTVHQRQSHLTVVDSNFTQLLLQMQGKIRTQGHGFFIILPDLPSPDCPNLPSLCYRRSRGMLSRVSMSNKSERSMYDSIRLFESGEGESIKDCSCPVSFIDSVTVSEEFVEDLDRFVLVMDEVSNGQFLRGEENGLGSDWVELKWLKAKGYYSLEAFVANRFDVALRLSWMNCNYGKKKGGKLKEKVTASGVASNIFWRKKGCMDWWAKLDAGVRRKVLQFVLGKTAKSLTDEILRGTLGALEEERWLFSVGSEQPLRYHTTVSRQMTKPSLLETVSEFSSTISFSSVSEQSKSFVKVLRGLLVLQDISALISACKDGDYGREKLFFTSLASVCTISDCLLRKIRGILLSVSLDCTRLELLGDGNLKFPTEKPKEKSNASSRRKKGKARKFKGMNLASSAAAHDKSVKDQGCELARIQHVDMMGSDQVVGAHQEKNINRQALLQAVQMDNGQGSGGKVPTAARKNKKRSNKNKEDKSKKPGSARHLTVQMEVAKTDRMSESSLLQNANADVSTGNDNLLPNSSPFISRSGPKEVDGPAQIIQGDLAADSPSTPLMDLRTLQENGNAKCDVEKVGEADTKSVFTAKPIKAIDSKDGFTPVQQKFGKYYDTGPINSSVYPSHEWPSIAPHQYPSFNSNLPATTDRLHLDVGRNWILPPSLDWPPMVRNVSSLLASPMTCKFMDFSDMKNTQELADDWEEEFEVHAVSNRDYNQYFGGGVMYWNSSDRFSRPPSLCSDDSSWARHEADMNVAVDDIIAFSSSSTMTESASEEKVSGFSDVEGKSVGDSLPYHILRPIVIPNMSRERSRSEFKHSHRIKRPPSPMVLCVPGPPPPSPVKHRGFPTVRSGSSSPRNWMCMDGSEVVWPSWRKKGISGCPIIQPLPGALLQDRLIAMSQLARDQDHPDVALPLQPPELLKCPTRNSSLSTMHNLLHDEIDSFCKRVAAENLSRKPYVNWAVKRVTRSLQVLWPRSRTNIFGSNATGLSLPTSDVDLVVCLPPVRNLEPIKEAGILEGRNGIKETCLQHAARYLANQEWVKTDSLKTVENTAIPIIMLVVEVAHDIITSSASLMTNDGGKNAKSVRLDISFKSPTHTGLQTTELVKELTEQFPAAMPLALVLKQFLADRSLDHSYSGGLSSYCLVLLITRFLQHEHHLGRPINQNFGSLLMDFLYFFGNVFDPRHMRISVQGSGLYINRERGYSIDPIHIDDPLFPTNNVGRNCFRIHQCTKAFSDAYTILEKELSFLQKNDDSSVKPSYRLLPKIIPNIDLYI